MNPSEIHKTVSAIMKNGEEYNVVCKLLLLQAFCTFSSINTRVQFLAIHCNTDRQSSIK